MLGKSYNKIKQSYIYIIVILDIYRIKWAITKLYWSELNQYICLNVQTVLPFQFYFSDLKWL